MIFKKDLLCRGRLCLGKMWTILKQIPFLLHLSWDYIGEAIDVVSRFSGHQHKTNAAGGHLYLLLNGLFTESVPKDKGFVLEAKAFFSAGGLHSIKRRLNAVSAVQTLKIKLLYGRYLEGRVATTHK